VSTVETLQDLVPDRRIGDAARRLARDTPLVQLLALVLIFGYGAVTLTGFASAVSIKSMLLISAFLGLAAIGQTILVLVGQLDLSVPGFIGLGNVLLLLLVGEYHWPFALALLLVLAVSGLSGSVSGLLCYLFQVESIVVTIGMNFALMGLLDLIGPRALNLTAPAWLTRFASVTGTTGGVDVPPILVLWLIVAIVVALVLRRTVIGRHVYLTGANPAAARLALVPTARVVIGAFALSAVAAAGTGVLLAGYIGGANPQVGTPYLFSSITAIIVGGTALGGARGDYWRTVIGALMLTIVNTVLLAHGGSAAQQQVLYGLIILLVGMVYGREPRLRDRV